MKFSRRKFLASVAVVGVGSLGLADCADVTTQVPVWIAGFQAIADEISLVLPQLQAAGLSGADAANVSNFLAEARQVLSVIGSASTASQGTSVLTTIEGYINAIAPLVLPFVTLIPGGTVIGLIIAALPALEFALNFVVSLLTPTALAVAATAPAAASASGRFGGRRGHHISLHTSQMYLNILISRSHRHFMGSYR